MALQLKYPSVFGTIDNAYCRICAITWEDSPTARLGLQIYISAHARSENKPPVETRSFEIPVSNLMASGAGESMRGIAYAFIVQSDPLFESATNV